MVFVRKNKFIYTTYVARHHIKTLPADRGVTDQPTDGWIHPLVELPMRYLKSITKMFLHSKFTVIHSENGWSHLSPVWQPHFHQHQPRWVCSHFHHLFHLWWRHLFFCSGHLQPFLQLLCTFLPVWSLHWRCCESSIQINIIVFYFLSLFL